MTAFKYSTVTWVVVCSIVVMVGVVLIQAGQSPRVKLTRTYSDAGGTATTTAALTATALASTEPASSELTNEPTPFASSPCWFSPLGSELSVHCGYLAVQGEALSYQLPVVIIGPGSTTSSTPMPSANPIFYLGGGPGAGLGLGAEQIDLWLDWYQQQHLQAPLVLMDYRGTGLSEPGFTCQPFVQTYTRSLTEPESLTEGALFQTTEQCLGIWHARGFKESDFTSQKLAEDFHTLAGALGYNRIDLYAISFGTRVALALAGNSPSLVGKTILDSPVFAAKAGVNYWPERLTKAFQNYFAHCRQNDSCVYNEAQMFRLLANLKNSPQTVEVNRWRTPGDVWRVQLTDQLMLSILYSGFYRPQELHRFAFVAKDGVTVQDKQLIAAVEAYVNDTIDEEFNYFVYYANQCMDNSAYEAQVYSGYPISSQWTDYVTYQPDYDVCQLFQRPEQTPAANLANIQNSVLLLSGGLDPVTLASDAKLLTAAMPNARLALFSHSGHGVLGSNLCLTGLLATYFNAAGSDRWLQSACPAAELE